MYTLLIQSAENVNTANEGIFVSFIQQSLVSSSLQLHRANSCNKVKVKHQMREKSQ